MAAQTLALSSFSPVMQIMPLHSSIIATSAAPSVRYGVRYRLIGLCLLIVFTAITASAKGPEPPQRIPLDPLGYQTISNRYLLEGATMVTVDYVDNLHLLVTFGVSKLMLRMADCPPDDQDRTVKAVLLELPSGRELAHTEWRFHDVGQYLWNLGGGHFLLRNRDTLTTFAPLQELGSAEPFAQRPFLALDRRIQAVLVSANHDLLTVETTKRPPREPSTSMLRPAAATSISSATQGSDASPAPQTLPSGLHRRDPAAKPDPAPFEISFIRLMHRPDAPFSNSSAKSDPASPTHIVAEFDGKVRTAKAVQFPVTAEGLLEIKAESRDGVLLDFLTFTGKVIELGDFATSCPPKPTFVSPSEFIAFGCRGSDEALELGAFNLRGDLMWLTNFNDLQAYPSVVSSIPTGRFALSRTTTLTNVFGSETPSMDQLTGQEVRVIQTYNGKQLLKVFTSPIQRAGQNFTLSPDGMGLAVIHDNASVRGDVTLHNTAVEIYKLPPLSGKDQSEVKIATAMAPAPSGAHIRFSIEEIKEALARKPGSEPSQSAEPSDPDSRIVGDDAVVPTPVATAVSSAVSNSQTGSIPASDPAPACANLTDTTASSAAAACPVVPKQKPASDPSASPVPSTLDDQPTTRRKPPTLYEPAPPSSTPQ